LEWTETGGKKRNLPLQGKEKKGLKGVLDGGRGRDETVERKKHQNGRQTVAGEKNIGGGEQNTHQLIWKQQKGYAKKWGKLNLIHTETPNLARETKTEGREK